MDSKVSEHNFGIVLLHGAGLGSWIWEKVIPLLSYPVLAVDLPRTIKRQESLRMAKIDDMIRFTIGEIEKSGFDKCLIVCHSVSGTIGLAVASVIPRRVTSLVFVGAGLPDTGRSYLEDFPLFSRLLLRFFSLLFPKGLRAPDSMIQQALCNDLNEADINKVLINIVPESPHFFFDPVHWKSLSQQSTYVKLTNDKSDLNPIMQEKMIRKLVNPNVVLIESGHLPMISKPGIIAGIINESVQIRRANENL